MKFFSKNKLKIKKEILKDGVKLNIDYYKTNLPKDHKIEVIKRLMGLDKCLVVINPKFMYKEQDIDYRDNINAILSKLEELNIIYKKVIVKRKQEIVIFGVKAKQSDGEVYNDYIIGIVVGQENIKDINTILDNYNLQYFVNNNKYKDDELLSKFETNFDDDDKMMSESEIRIVDDNFMKIISVYCKVEDVDQISNILIRE